jgi:hypothetical protein
VIKCRQRTSRNVPCPASLRARYDACFPKSTTTTLLRRLNAALGDADEPDRRKCAFDALAIVVGSRCVARRNRSTVASLPPGLSDHRPAGRVRVDTVRLVAAR